MNPESRLAEIIDSLEAVGLDSLIMGGHAVRFYGLDRNTVDFELQVAPDCWNELSDRLGRSRLFHGNPPIEGPSWRPNAFRRFQIGTLPNGREEWLEFWRQNHLLGPFAELFSRRESGMYGGRVLPFLALRDLIRSKETERESDWQDIAFLEEFLDARMIPQAGATRDEVVTALSQLRSRRGFERLLQTGQLSDASLIRQAVLLAKNPITHAFLLPSLSANDTFSESQTTIEPVVLARLRKESPGSNLHLALVESVRRQYKLVTQAAD